METADESISLLYNQVVDGIADLRHTFLGEEKVESITAPSQATIQSTTANPVVSPVNDLQSAIAKPINTLMEQINESQDIKILSLLNSLEKIDQVKEYAAEYSDTKQFSFELATADGDTISITANRSSSSVASASKNENGRIDITQDNQSQQFSLAIDGDLDEGEIEAITHLMQQVMSLSEQFYNGDIGAAYQAALELDYDSSEITSYALQLNQTESYEVSAIYEEVASNNFSLPAELTHSLEKINDYAQQLLQEILNTENYQHIQYAQMIDVISQQLDQQIIPTDTYRFNDSIVSIIEKAGIENKSTSNA